MLEVYMLWDGPRISDFWVEAKSLQLSFAPFQELKATRQCTTSSIDGTTQWRHSVIVWCAVVWWMLSNFVIYWLPLGSVGVSRSGQCQFSHSTKSIECRHRHMFAMDPRGSHRSSTVCRVLWTFLTQTDVVCMWAQACSLCPSLNTTSTVIVLK